VTLSESQAPRAQATVFVSDPSAEAERIAQTLRAAGYLVVDVPLSMLVARVAVQRPRVILVDADGEGALEAVGRMRELPESSSVDVLFCGRAGHALTGVEDALAHEGSGFFPRPVDVPELVKKIGLLTGGVSAPPPPSKRPSVAPPILPPASIRSEKLPSQPPQSLPAPSQAVPSARPSQPPMSAQSIPPEVAVRRGTHIQAPLSDELQQLLADAEDRVAAAHSPMESHPPSPEEEIEAVLPEEILAALDEPLEEEDDDDDHEPSLGAHNRATTSGGSKHTTGTGMRQQQTTGSGGSLSAAQTNDGSQFLHNRTHSETGATTNAGRTHGVSSPPREGYNDGLSEVPPPNDPRVPLPAFGRGPISPTAQHDSAPPPRTEHAPSAFSTTLGSELLAQNMSSFDARPGSVPTDTSSANALPAMRSDLPPPMIASRKAESVPPPQAVPSVLGPGDAPRTLARAIASRVTGTLCFESKDGVRRAVLREGDLVTTASGVDDESLLAFLGARGDLPRERLAQLAGRFATFGRHAGAALVAHGYLRQDQLWPVLRAHAEWILGRAILTPEGTALIEPEPPGRLRGEPSVFGGSTGAEVFVEVVRRVVSTDDAIARLGGISSRVGPGENSALLTECALSAGEAESVKAAEGLTVGEVLATHPESDMASLLYALDALGVMDVLRSIDGARKSAESAVSVDALDVDAIRARVRARIEIVDEGDYFAVLGVSRSATGYEVKRAFLELRRAFDPARLLTPPIADLASDVRKIVTVLEEAYEILRDGARRERYRRAIDNSPG
jgi:hypothetical protein